NISALKSVLANFKKVEKRVFLVEDCAHLSVAQAYALGATAVLIGPLNQLKLLKEVGDCTPAASSAAEEGSAAAAASSGEVALASMFTAAAAGTSIDVSGAKAAGARIAAAVEEHGLSNWLTTVRRHHEG